jgi:hypothetical protein
VSACSYSFSGEEPVKQPPHRFDISEFSLPPADTVPVPSPIDELLTRMIGPTGDSLTAEGLAVLAAQEQKKAEAEQKSRHDAAKTLADIDTAIKDMAVLTQAQLNRENISYEEAIVVKIKKRDYLAAIRYAGDFLGMTAPDYEKAYIWHNLAYCWYEFSKPVQNSTLKWECLKRAIDAQGQALALKRQELKKLGMTADETYATWLMEAAMLVSIWGNETDARKLYKRAQDAYDACHKSVAEPLTKAVQNK